MAGGLSRAGLGGQGAMRPVALWALVIFGLDQLSKYLVVHRMRLDQVLAIDVFPPWLQFRMAWNRGVNFGLFAHQADMVRWGLIVLSLVICAWVWFWVARGGHGPWAKIAAGVLLGGAMGNVIDRLAYGAVADFLNMSLPGFDNPWSFNIADIAIFAGAFGLALFSPSGGGKAARAGRGGPGRKDP